MFLQKMNSSKSATSLMSRNSEMNSCSNVSSKSKRPVKSREELVEIRKAMMKRSRPLQNESSEQFYYTLKPTPPHQNRVKPNSKLLERLSSGKRPEVSLQKY
jgi:hypothetical protein